MFGYVTINPAELDEGAKHRYQMYYCGLCRALLRRHGHIGQLTLSYDMTFLLMKHNRFNPLKAFHDSPHFSDLCKDSLTLMIAETAEAFEVLPLAKDVDILRNILYSGVWARYQRTLAKPSRQDEKMKERT